MESRAIGTWAARENDPEIIDRIGIAETIQLAETRFAQFAEEYLSSWADTDPPIPTNLTFAASFNGDTVRLWEMATGREAAILADMA
ncbi:MAG TPA: hypothetical protein VMI94_11875 [Bryobacteraceae bacterium]|nr:hypothetical protein [Bryobacteraceae bacterium]